MINDKTINENSTIEELQKKLKKPAIIFKTGGFRPTNKLLESWIGKVGWKKSNESLSECEGMIPLATIFLEGLNYIPKSLENIKLITIFMKKEILDNLDLDDFSEFFQINLYTSLEDLISCDYQSDEIKAFPLSQEYVTNDYPSWDDLDDEICEIITKKEEKEGIEYYNDIYEENYSYHKLGGYPSSIQYGVGFEEGFEYVLQITSDEKAEFNIVDSGNFYFAYNPKTNKWEIRCDFY